MFLFRPYFSNYSNVGEQHLILFLRTNHVIKIVDIASLHGSGMAMSTKKIPDFKSFFKYLKQNSNIDFCLGKCVLRTYVRRHKRMQQHDETLAAAKPNPNPIGG